MEKVTYLHLNGGSDIQPFGHGWSIRFERTYFSGGEVHITLNDLHLLTGVKEVVIVCGGGHRHDPMEILQASDILRRNGIKWISLYMPYFYYSRQDRATTPSSSNALKLQCQILAIADFDTIWTHDLHSPVALQYFSASLEDIKPYDFLLNVWCRGDYEFIIAPDAGAAKKIVNITSKVGIHSSRVLTASKYRDPATGSLGSPQMSCDDIYKLSHSKCLVFDDICDGGYTFIQLAKYINNTKEANCRLDLAVTHGIFSKGTQILLSEYGKIFTSDSFDPTYGTEIFKHETE
tara:strand:+ start:421 stop:1293 length:873 start_codon:yes stop_codon:yes gene_type:complete